MKYLPYLSTLTSLSAWLVFAFLWWVAAFSPVDWTVRIYFNAFYEEWIEGVMFHAFIIMNIVTFVWMLRKAKKEDSNE